MNDKAIPYANLINFAGLTLVIAVTLLLMIYGKPIILPMVIALVITFLINAIAKLLERFSIGRFKIPGWLSRTLTILLFAQLFRSLMRMSVTTVRDMIADSELILENLKRLLTSMPSWLLALLPADMLTQESAYDIGSMLNMLVEGLSGLLAQFLAQAAFVAGQSLIILVYVIFMLIERRRFAEKLGEMFSDQESNETLKRVIASIGDMTGRYFSIKTIVSLLVAVSSFVVMWLFDLNNATFWAILVFLLNYIPYVGSIVAVIFPVLFSLAQFGDWTIFLALTIILYAIQIVAGSLIEPTLAGRTLDLSPLVVFASLTTFGTIWGVTGMILSVPLVIIMVITFSHFEATRPIAVLLSGRGKLDAYEPEVMVKRRRPATSIEIGEVGHLSGDQ